MPKNGQNGPFRAGGGKNQIDRCNGTEISVVLPLGIIRIDEKTAPLRPIFAENQFSPAGEGVLMGLVVRKCHFDVTACAEARRLAQRAERSLRDLSALWASRRASRAGWKSLVSSPGIEVTLDTTEGPRSPGSVSYLEEIVAHSLITTKTTTTSAG